MCLAKKRILYHMLSNVLKPYCSQKNAILRLIIMLMSIMFIHFPYISQLFPSTKWPCEAFINLLPAESPNSSARCCWNWCRAHQLLCEPKRKFILVCGPIAVTKKPKSPQKTPKRIEKVPLKESNWLDRKRTAMCWPLVVMI